MSLDRCIETLKRGELVDEATVSELCEKLKEALFFEPNVVPVAAPVTVVANVHGQLPDVLELFRVCGAAPDTNYLVAGDVCDYGHWSLETALLLVCLRLRYPARVTLLRGEHETRTCTALYGTYRESMRKFVPPSLHFFKFKMKLTTNLAGFCDTPTPPNHSNSLSSSSSPKSTGESACGGA